MNADEEHLITVLLLKYGDAETLADKWLHADPELSDDECNAIIKFIGSTRFPKPFKVEVPKKEGPFRYITVNLDINLEEKD